jgi:hypothetical protein
MRIVVLPVQQERRDQRGKGRCRIACLAPANKDLNKHRVGSARLGEIRSTARGHHNSQSPSPVAPVALSFGSVGLVQTASREVREVAVGSLPFVSIVS